MWHCVRCREEIEDNFDVCWSCGLPRSDDAPEAAPGTDPDWDVEELGAAPPARLCVACETPLVCKGVAPIRVGGPDGPDDGWNWFPDPDQVEQKLWKVEVWSCPSCRRLEFCEPEPE